VLEKGAGRSKRRLGVQQRNEFEQRKETGDMMLALKRGFTVYVYSICYCAIDGIPSPSRVEPKEKCEK